MHLNLTKEEMEADGNYMRCAESREVCVRASFCMCVSWSPHMTVFIHNAMFNWELSKAVRKITDQNQIR